MPPVHVVLADSHPIFLTGLEQLLSVHSEFRVIASCNNAEEALAAVRKHRPDVLLLDLGALQPVVDLIRCLKQEKHPTRFLVLSGSLDDRSLVELLRLGVRGVVLKDLAPHLLLKHLREVHEGRLSLDARLAQTALEKLLELEPNVGRSTLTSREVEVSRLLASGLDPKEIAAALSLSSGTVSNHLHRVYAKLGLRGARELILYAYETGLMPTRLTRHAVATTTTGSAGATKRLR